MPGKAAFQGAADCKTRKGQSYWSQSVEGRDARWQSRCDRNLQPQGASWAGSGADRGTGYAATSRAPKPEDWAWEDAESKGRPERARLCGQAAQARAWQTPYLDAAAPSLPTEASCLRDLLAQPEAAPGSRRVRVPPRDNPER